MICGFEPTDIPALRKKDSKKEEEEADNSTDPSVEDERGRLVQQSLVFLIRCQKSRNALQSISRDIPAEASRYGR